MLFWVNKKFDTDYTENMYNNWKDSQKIPIESWIQIKNNIETPKNLEHFYQRGYRGFSITRFDKEMNRLGADEKKLGGIPNSGPDIIQKHWTALEKYVNDYVGEYTCEDGENPVREVGEIGDMPFNRTLGDWLKFDINKRTKFDAAISSGLAIMACNRHLYHPKPQVEKSKINLKIAKYTNSGGLSKLIEK